MSRCLLLPNGELLLRVWTTLAIRGHTAVYRLQVGQLLWGDAASIVQFLNTRGLLKDGSLLGAGSLDLGARVLLK